MQFSPQFIDDLSSRVQTSQIVGNHVKLAHKGGGEYLGLCPFHKEKTPSFSVSDNKNFYHCFGCGAHGNSIKFIMEIEGLSFIETITKLANIAGVTLPKPDKFQQENYEKQLTLYDICDEACKWFEKQLALTGGSSALNYLKKRSISDKSIKTFRLGYAPDGRSSLKSAMLKKGFNEQQLIDVGLIIKPENASSNSYDRFRSRVIFPIMDLRGRTIAFGGRILGDGQPKYLNSPETELFHKGNILYGFDLARQKAYDKKNIIAVEGYMDVIAMFEAGIDNVVAPLGTAITDNQLKLMWKVANEPILCMDGDSAGKRSMAKAAHNCLPFLEPGYSLRFASLPAGQDPDDLIKHRGKDALTAILDSAKSLSQSLWDITLGGKNLNTPEQKAHFEQRLMQITEQISNDSVAGYYRRHFKDQLWDAQKRSKSKKTTLAQTKVTAINTEALVPNEVMLILAPYYHPELMDNSEIQEDYNHLDFSEPNLNILHSNIVEILSNEEIKSHEEIKQHIDDKKIIEMIAFIERNTPIDPSIKPTSQSHMASAAWDYNLSYMQSEIISREYYLLVNDKQSMSNECHERLNELKKQKDALKKLVKSKYLSYEAALDE